MQSRLQLALNHHQSGDLAAAERLYRDVLAQDAEQPTALHYLGVIALQRGELSEARRQIEASLRRESNDISAWNNLSHVLLLQGHWTDSLRCAGEVLDRDPQNAIALNHQGSALLKLRQEAAAVDSFRAAIQSNERYAEAWSNLGRALMLRGRAEDLAEAERCCRRAIEVDPRLAAAYNHLGLVLNQRSQLPEALQAFQTAVRLAPKFMEAVANAAVTLAETGNAQASVDMLFRLPEPQRDQVDIQRALGYVFQRLNDSESSLRHFLRAVELRPDSVESLVNLGIALRQEGRLDEAVEVLHRAATRCPQDVTILNSLANVLRDQGQNQGARELYDVALKMEPAHVLLRLNRASLCEQIGDTDVARDDLNAAARESDGRIIDASLCHLRLAAICPGAGATAAHYDDYRRQLLETCHRLADNPSCANWTSHMLQHHAPFPPLGLLYQPVDNRSLREAFAAAYRPALGRLANAIAEKPVVPELPRTLSGVHQSNPRPRVGFFVSRRHEPVFARCMSGIVNQLDTDALEPVIVANSSALAKLDRHLDPERVATLRIGESLEQAALNIRSAQLNVLHFWEIGTDPMNYLLPFLRTAPVQVTSWGVPDTSGLKEVDAYLSSTLVETPWGAELGQVDASQYTERLLLADTLLTYQRPATAPFAPSSWRASLGIEDHHHLYLCTQKLEKLHPDFDAYLVEILRRDPRGVIGLFADRHAAGTVCLQHRLAAVAGDVVSRIRFFAHQSYSDYLLTLDSADVVLDTLHCGGGLTAYDAFSLAKPVVTQPGDNARSRYALACYRKLNLLDCVVASHDAYVAQVVRIAADEAYREWLTSEIRSANYLLFEDREAIFEMQRLLLELV